MDNNFDYNYSDSESDFLYELKLDSSENRVHRRREEKRRRKELKFSNKKHPKTAVISVALSVCTIILFISSVIISAAASGNAGIIVGLYASAGFVFALVGFILGAVSFIKTDVFYGMAWFGVISNGILWLLIGVIMVMGF